MTLGPTLARAPFPAPLGAPASWPGAPRNEVGGRVPRGTDRPRVRPRPRSSRQSRGLCGGRGASVGSEQAGPRRPPPGAAATLQGPVPAEGGSPASPAPGPPPSRFTDQRPHGNRNRKLLLRCLPWPALLSGSLADPGEPPGSPSHGARGSEKLLQVASVLSREACVTASGRQASEPQCPSLGPGGRSLVGPPDPPSVPGGRRAMSPQTAGPQYPDPALGVPQGGYLA